jgi:acetyl-CoA carboxylase carboxyltransferase component
MIGPESERAGVLRHGARALQAIYGATVPVITIQVRRSFGIGGMATGNPTQLTIKLAWPSARLGDLPIEGGVAAAFRKEIEAASNPQEAMREIEERMLAKTSVWQTAEHFGLEDVIDPRETRRVIHRWLEGALHSLRPGPKAGPKNRP